MKLLAISSPGFIPEEASMINRLFGEGLECFHIRKPESKKDDFARLLSQINPAFLGKTAIHQHHELSREFDIKRLHFTENKRLSTSEEQFIQLEEKGFTLSTSIHNLADLDRVPATFSYTFFGPVFNSISKRGYKGMVAKDFFIDNELKKIPVIGLGGVEIANLQNVRDMNFDGAAVLGALWREPSKAPEVLKTLLAATKQVQP
jgi:thiamine-phosphate pyrophosphorylase